jgi:hypothetical protein
MESTKFGLVHCRFFVLHWYVIFWPSAVAKDNLTISGYERSYIEYAVTGPALVTDQGLLESVGKTGNCDGLDPGQVYQPSVRTGVSASSTTTAKKLLDRGQATHW